MPSLRWEDVERAREIVGRYLKPSRLVEARSLSRATGAQVFLKLESEQPTGSFKPRGALTALTRNLERGPVAGVVTSSTGNHGAATAYAARLLGVPATVFLPANPNPVKRARIADLGAHIVEAGDLDLAEAFDRAAAFAREHGLYFMEDGRDPDMPPGTATIACEVLEQLPDADALFVPMGDTTLIRGVAFAAKHLKPGIQILGVQAERAPAYTLSWRAGKAIATATCDTIADGLATRRPLEENVHEIRERVDDVRLVSEAEMLAAIRRLHGDEQVVAEPAGAATTAALLQDAAAFAGKNLVLLVTGSNVAPDVLQAAIRA
ncbi:MAG TPA: pyridoxal-phosphate dependent enzyme [Terriglobales bacterium]|nr:pyridoxal-phosphate dependent enzyme [Terriglobales bacterium]